MATTSRIALVFCCKLIKMNPQDRNWDSFERKLLLGQQAVILGVFDYVFAGFCNHSFS